MDKSLDNIVKAASKYYELVLIPAEKDLCKFQVIVGYLHKRIQTNGSEITMLSSLRDTLLPKLMSGEINLEQYGNQ